MGVVESQVKLQKLDFWVRNQDFLANELLNDYADTGDAGLLELAAEILESDEPEAPPLSDAAVPLRRVRTTR